MTEKKDHIAGAFDNLLGTPAQAAPKEEKKPVGRPPKEGIQREGAGTGLPEEWQRYTLIVNKQTLQDLKDYAWYERISIKEAVDNILSGFLENAEFERPKK